MIVDCAMGEYELAFHVEFDNKLMNVPWVSIN